MYDVIIVGAGSVGCATARELSRYRLRVLVLEKGHDLCAGASKCNSGMIHAGYDPIPGTNEAKFNAPGCALMYRICDELEVPYLKNGTTVFATDENGMRELYKLEGFAKENHVRAEVITPPALYELQPEIGKDVRGILWVPDGGTTNPFTVTFAMAENAFANGVEFRKEARVTGIGKTGDGFQVTVNQEEVLETRMVVNCAGGHSDVINNMVSETKFRIIPRFGAHVVLDRKHSDKLTTTLMETPHDLPGGGHTKGMAIITTTGGTMLLGCDATEVDDPDFTDTRRESIEQIVDYFKKAWKDLPPGSDGTPFPEDEIISIFGGCRPHADTNDFVIGEPDDAPGFVNAGGTESPAFTACYAIGQHVAGICVDRLKPPVNESFNPRRHVKKAFRDMTNEERRAAIAENPDYAKIVCRCEMVTEAEIRGAIRRPLGARSISEVKLRTRAGMGRCQGGFCSPRVLEILSEELGISPLEVTQCGGASKVLAGPACNA
ncbi:MAG: NAD(P)/FAD-dependent oxidoreductase [Eubacteriales bacterium]|nr:NAD(P)/FAD-dependent oxidoreductase [Eubacteriales bacterium]